MSTCKNILQSVAKLSLEKISAIFSDLRNTIRSFITIDEMHTSFARIRADNIFSCGVIIKTNYIHHKS